MTPNDLEAIQKRWEASTAGMWKWDYNGLQTEILSEKSLSDTAQSITTVAYWDDRDRADEPSKENLDFIVHAHQDVPALLNYVEHLLGRIEDLRYDYDHNRKE